MIFAKRDGPWADGTGDYEVYDTESTEYSYGYPSFSETTKSGQAAMEHYAQWFENYDWPGDRFV